MTDIHYWLDRMILRNRWVRWWLKTWRADLSKRQIAHRLALSDRLTKHKPMYEQLQPDEIGEMDQ